MKCSLVDSWKLAVGCYKSNYALCILNYALLATLLLTSCTTDELCYSHPHEGNTYVKFDTSDVPDNHCKDFRLWVYSADESEYVPFDLTRSGGSINIIRNEYRLLAHNNDTEWVTFKNHSGYDTHSVTTNDCDILYPLKDGKGRATSNSELLPVPGERVALEPEPVYSAGVEKIAITPGDTINLKLSSRYNLYSVEFRNTGSLKDVAQMSAAISGMAESVYLSSGNLSAETVTIPFSVTAGDDDNSIVGTFHTFGHNESATTPHRIALYLIMKSGKQYKFTSGDHLDVSEQVHNSSDKNNLRIIVSGIEIPGDNEIGGGESGGGWDVGLDDWDEVNIEIGA